LLRAAANAADNAKSPTLQGSLFMALSPIVTPHFCGRSDRRLPIDTIKAID
jgi:hypothetical protein